MTPQSSVDVATTDGRTKYEIKASFWGQHLSRAQFSKGRSDLKQNVAQLFEASMVTNIEVWFFA